MNETEARNLIRAHDDECKQLNRKPKYELAAIETAELAAHGMTRLWVAGPLSKDELIHSILDLRYPAARQDEARHTIYHQSYRSEVCQFCTAAAVAS